MKKVVLVLTLALLPWLGTAQTYLCPGLGIRGNQFVGSFTMRYDARLYGLEAGSSFQRPGVSWMNSDTLQRRGYSVANSKNYTVSVKYVTGFRLAESDFYLLWKLGFVTTSQYDKYTKSGQPDQYFQEDQSFSLALDVGVWWKYASASYDLFTRRVTVGIHYPISM